MSKYMHTYASICTYVYTDTHHTYVYVIYIYIYVMHNMYIHLNVYIRRETDTERERERERERGNKTKQKNLVAPIRLTCCWAPERLALSSERPSQAVACAASPPVRTKGLWVSTLERDGSGLYGGRTNGQGKALRYMQLQIG